MLTLQQRSAGKPQVISPNPSSTLSKQTMPVGSADVVRHESVLVALRREDQSFLRKLLLIFCMVFGAEWFAAFWFGPEPPGVIRGEKFQLRYRIDINSATWVEWLQLDGIGPALAHRLQVDREINGPYCSIDDLQRVPGIGPSILEQIRPWLIEPVSACVSELESEGSSEQTQADEAQGTSEDSDDE